LYKEKKGGLKMVRPDGPLHIKYRAQSLDEIQGKGNKEMVETLRLLLSREKDRATSYLFYGPAGCGKTTLAYILKSMLEVSDMDFVEYNGANNRGIDTARSVISSASLSPLMGKYKIFFFDEAHQLTKAGEEALLKILEKPPKGVIFILCTTVPDKFLSTTLRRLTSFQVSLLDMDEIIDFLSWVLKEEKVEGMGSKVLRRIAQDAEGSSGTALKILDQIIDCPDDESALAAIDKVYISDKQTIDICKLLNEKMDPIAKWKRMSKLIQEIQSEPEDARYSILGYFTKILLNSPQNDRASEFIDLFSGNFYDSKRFGLINTLYLACKK
jgi:DNA polymerase III subunit gamma/tau